MKASLTLFTTAIRAEPSCMIGADTIPRRRPASLQPTEHRGAIMRGVRNLILTLVFSLVMPVMAFGNGISCLHQATLRSTATGRPAIITFVNNSRHAANIYWIDYAGKPSQHFNVTPGSVISRNSLVTHPWVITDDYDNCIGVAFANPSTPNVEITNSGIVFSGTSGPVLADNPAYAKQAKHGDDEAGGPQAIQAMHHDEAGTVTYRGQLGGRGGEIFSLKIGPVHEGKSWVAVYVGANGCLGEMAGQATVRGDVLELTKDDGGNDCRLTIHRSATGATIVENNCTFDHGLSCSFDTQGKTLRQVSVAKAPVAAAPLATDRPPGIKGTKPEVFFVYGEPVKEEPCKTGIPDSNHTWDDVKGNLPPEILATPKTPMSHDAIVAALKKLSDENSTRAGAALKQWESVYEAKHPDKNLMNLIDAFNDGKGAEALAGLDPKKVDPKKVPDVQKQIDQGQALYCVYSAMRGE
jgi:hypothetical protein